MANTSTMHISYKTPILWLVSAAVMLNLTACNKTNATTQAVSADAAVEASAVVTTPVSTTTMDLDNSLFFTGVFELTPEMRQGQKSFEKWRASTEDCDGRCGDAAWSDTLPKKYKPFTYEHPLFGNGKSHMINVIPASLISIYLNPPQDSTAMATIVTQGKEWLVQGSLQVQGNVNTLTLTAADAQAPQGDWLIQYDSTSHQITGSWSGASGKQTFVAKAYDRTKLSGKDLEEIACGNKVNPSTTLIKNDTEWHQSEVRCMRNMIAAQHGKAFSNADVRAMFEERGFAQTRLKDAPKEYYWYVPLRENVSNYTDIELKNLEILKKIEKEALPDLTVYWG